MRLRGSIIPVRFIYQANKLHHTIMNRSVILVSGLCIALLFASCSPRPVYRLSPQANNTTFNQGTEYVHLTKNGIGLTISYYRHLDDRFVMDVEIVNNTDSVLRVGPQQFSYQAYKFTSATIPWEKDNIIAAAKAINPEQKILKTDMAISEIEADQRTSDLLYAIGTAASVASSVTANTEEEREEIKEDQEDSYVWHQINQRERELNQLSLRDRRKVWEIDAFRKTDLFPDEYIRGYIFFKNNNDAQGYNIRFDSQKATFSIFYQQKRYEVE